MSYEEEYTLSFSTKNADMNSEVKVTVNGNIMDIKKYVGSIKNLEDKADEYEAKAKAFDRIVEQRKKTGVITLGHYAWNIIKEYESGEQEALDIMK